MSHHEREDGNENEAIEAYLQHLRGRGPAPDVNGDDPRLFDILDAITDMAGELPPLEDDPVLQALELTTPEPLGARIDDLEIAFAGRGAATPRKLEVFELEERPKRRTAVRAGRRLTGALPTVAAVVALVMVAGTGLVAKDGRPAGAVERGQLTSSCQTTFRGTPETIAAGVPHVVVAAVWAGKERERFVKVLDRFVERTGITVSLATDPPDADRDIGATLDRLAEQGCAPDVALLPQPGLLTTLATAGRLFPLDPGTLAEVRRNYSRAWQDLGEVDGISYGVWFKAANKSIVWYNANAFAQAGIVPPTSWQELKDAAAKLHAAGIAPFAIAGAPDDSWVLSDWFENVFLRQAGSSTYEALATGRLAWTDPAVTAALAQLAEIFSRDEWLAGGRAAALATTYEQSVAKVFANTEHPDAAMVFEGDFVANEVAKTRSTIGVDARFFAFPSMGTFDPTVVGGGGPSAPGEAGGDVGVMMTSSEAGKAFVRFLASAEAAEPWVESGGFISPNKAVTAYPDATSKLAADQLLQAEALHFDLSDRLAPAFGSDPNQGMWRILRDFLADPTDIQGTAQRLERESRASRP